MSTEINPEIVYVNTVDGGLWEVLVVRDPESPDRKGTLTVKCLRDLPNASKDEIILTETVGLSYGAIFGPDIDDVNAWQEMAIGAIDANYDGEQVQ